MSELVLVHGGMHGSWCWAQLRPELEALGHQVVTTDCNCANPTAGCTEFAEEVVGQLAAANEDAIIVGHSMSGLFLPLIPELRPVAGLIFLCALMPIPGQSFWETQGDLVIAGGGDRSLLVLDDGCLLYREPEARRLFYSDVDDATATMCIGRLRPQSSKVLTEPSPLCEWPNVPMGSIFCTEDPLVPGSYSRRMAERYRMPAVPLPGGHSPFFSRPNLLAQVIDRLSSEIGC